MNQLDYNYYIDVNKFIDVISNEFIFRSFKWKKDGGYYVLNCPVSFDIETSSFYIGENKQSIMYIWQFGFNGHVLIGRTWDDFKKFLSKLEIALNLDESNRIYIYVHNLSYEFQFMRKWFVWDEVFSTKERNPIYARFDGFEFRDSYILSGYKLETVGKNLQKYKVQKLVGYLDYDKIRTPETDLTEKEIQYCINDVLVVMAYIQELIDEYKQITKLPLTQTGKVRKFCRDNCFKGFSTNKEEKDKTKKAYKKLMHSLTIEPEEYQLCKWAFQGGFTHANVMHVGKVLTDMDSQDFTSSYPSSMLLDLFPMGKGTRVHIKSMDDYRKYADKYCMIFVVKLNDVKPKIRYEHPISFSKCVNIENELVNNGRVAYADTLTIACTNVDLSVYEKFYDFTVAGFGICYIYVKWYLPRNFLLSILTLYNDKTKLKGLTSDDGNIEKKYLHSKEMLNSCYGMCVTDIAKMIIEYNQEWDSENPNYHKPNESEYLPDLIDKYNKNRNRFLFYPWGIFVTSYCRRNLFTAIENLGTDYVYSDTDSVKFLHPEKHTEYFKKYNQMIIEKIKLSAKVNNIDINLYMPLTSKGVQKTIGVWDFDGHYKYFKTLGAKRYIYYDDNMVLHTTVAGCGKKAMTDYLNNTYIEPMKILKNFQIGLHVPAHMTGKNTHAYIDSEMSDTIIDYTGKEYTYYEKSGIHLEAADFTMSMSEVFRKFIEGYTESYEY